ncbi:hypothetical protein G7046_g6874 [Stylonectria norvegica]|nr:hypothetical protein G7046_g6874 [Stylonectria norvegica]
MRGQGRRDSNNVNPVDRDFSAALWPALASAAELRQRLSLAKLVLAAALNNFSPSCSSAMATTWRLGGTMLPRLALRSTLLRPASSRPFSASIRLRASGSDYNPEDGAPHRARSNPLVGNLPRPQAAETTFRKPVEPSKLSQQPTRAPILSPELSKTNEIPPPPPPAGGASSTSTVPAASSQTHPYSASNTTTPFNLDIASIIANKSSTFGQSISSDPLTRPKVRAKAVTGRTVFIKDRMSQNSAPTAVVALRVLNKMVRDQKIKTKFHSQKFHERKGLKRKRLRSERWRGKVQGGVQGSGRPSFGVEKAGVVGPN